MHTTLLSVVSDSLLSIDSALLWKVFDALLRIESVYQEYRLDADRESRYSEYQSRIEEFQAQWSEAWFETQRVVERIKRTLEAWQSLRGSVTNESSPTTSDENAPITHTAPQPTLGVEVLVSDAETKQAPQDSAGQDPHSVNVFVSYAREDDRYRVALHKHCAILIREGSISEWNDKLIVAGEEWEKTIVDALEQCDMMFLLVSPAFLHSDFCMTKEFARALERYKEGSLVIVAIIVHPCDWVATEISKFQALPSGARPISKWRSRDEALNNVVQGIRAALKAMRSSDATPPPPQTQ